MTISHSKYIIIGAGLSGLTTAYQLAKQGEHDIVILEGRDRIGGRIHTSNGIDLGATWFQNHHAHLSELMNDLGMEKFDQYTSGKSILVYNSMAPAHHFESDPNAPSAHRISGGSISLIEALAKPIANKIRLNTSVVKIDEGTQSITIQTTNGVFVSDKVVIALPPQLVTRINFEPPLAKNIISALENTHTWMSNAIKVGLTFKHPFWRDKGFSGTVIGQIGPTIELYDHSNSDDTSYGLMGFVNEGLRDESAEDRKERILSYLETHLGAPIRNYTTYQEKDWSIDDYTSCEKLKSVYISPRYGNPLYKEFYMNHKLLFSGAETSPVHGGYMDGAVYSGLNAASRLLE